MHLPTSITVLGCLSMAVASVPPRNDEIARQTPALRNYYGLAGLSPVPTAGPQIELRDGHIGPRSLLPDTCGMIALPSETFPLVCASSSRCVTTGAYMGCGNLTPHSRCFPGTATECNASRRSSLGPGTLCCVRLPRCATYTKDAGRNDVKTFIGCERPRLNGDRFVGMIPATAESSYFSSLSEVSATQTSTSASVPDGPETVSPQPEPPSSNSNSNTGAIVGGVVGGVAVVAVAVCIIVWLLVRRRRASKAEAPPPPATTPGGESYTAQPYAATSMSTQPQYGGYEDQYKYQAVPPVAPTPEIHEAPADSAVNNGRSRAELAS